MNNTSLMINLDKELTTAQIDELVETFNRWAPSRGLPTIVSFDEVQEMTQLEADDNPDGLQGYEASLKHVRDLAEELFKCKK